MTQLPQISCLYKAVQALSLQTRFYDTNKNVLGIQKGNKEHLFVNSSTPLGTASERGLYNDKEFTHNYLSKDIPMPKMKGYFTPFSKKETYIIHKTIEDITDNIKKEFSFPVVVKMNRGTKGRFVFLAHNEEQTQHALNEIYTKVDYIALVEEYIDIQKEYRVIILNNTIEFVYEKAPKFFSQKQKQEVRKRSRQTLPTVIPEHIEQFLSPLLQQKHFSFVGFDIVEDTTGNLALLEVNTNPLFSAFIFRYGEPLLIQMYDKMIRSLP
tara:strand:+ start:151 stop:954 length:804 start_codon:yes stop_codon:yes gene_type:complete